MLQIHLSMYRSDLVKGVMPKWENKTPTTKEGFLSLNPITQSFEFH